jgi:ribonuclease P protein component
MLKKSERLSRLEFANYFKSGKRTNTTNFTFIEYPFTGFKASVVVGKKVYKSAADRNKIKRQVYAKLRELRKETTSGVYLVLVKPPLAQLTSRQKKEVLNTELGRLIK